MRRRLFSICAGLSFLLWAATVILWVRSYFVADGMSWSNGKLVPTAGFQIAWRHDLIVDDGKITWIMDRSLGSQKAFVRRMTPQQIDLFPIFFGSPNRGNLNWNWKRWGFQFQSRNGIPMKSSNNNWRVEIGRIFTVPLWALQIVLTPLPLLWLIRIRHQRKLTRAGLCAVCGYDLRATRIDARNAELRSEIP